MRSAIDLYIALVIGSGKRKFSNEWDNPLNQKSSARSGRGVYSISVAAELSGLGPQTLRLYEQRGLLAPVRSAGGTRRYSDDDLQRLQRITELLADGVKIAGIGQILDLQDRNTRLESRQHPTQVRQLAAEIRQRPTHLRPPPWQNPPWPIASQERGTIVTSADGIPPADDIPEADLAEQRIPIDDSADEEGLDPTHLSSASAMDANPADLIDQAISVPLPADDYEIEQ
jgi:DNA-binding transcriptional MerR regulator